MQGHYSMLLSAALLLGATASTGQTLSCSSVSPEVREYVKQRGACRDTKPAAPRPKAAPRTDQKKADAPTSARKLAVPQLIGRTYADAVRELFQFTVESVDSASGKPAGTVLVQEPAAGSLVSPGSIISLQVSDGSLLKSASTAVVAVPVTAAAAPTPAPVSNSASASSTASPPLQETAGPAQPRGQSSTSITANGAVIFVMGASLGLLFGALWMRQRLLHHVPAATVIGFAPTLTPSPQPQPVVQSSADPRPIVQQSVDQQSADAPLPEEQVGEVAEVVEVAADSTPEIDLPPEIQFVAWLVPVETTIELVARAGELSSEHSSDHYA